MEFKPISEAMKDIWEWPYQDKSIEKVIKETENKNLEETNVEKEKAIIRLVDEFRNDELERLKRIKETSIEDVKLNSKAYKICESLYNIAQEKGMTIGNIIDCIPASCYTTEEEQKIAKITEDYYYYEKELLRKCDECKNLLVLCDTFEERMKLLKKYKIVK